MNRDSDIEMIRAACIKRQPKAKKRLREAICFNDILMTLGMLPGHVLFDKRGTEVEMVLRDENNTGYVRGTWDLLHDDIGLQTDGCIAIIAYALETYSPPQPKGLIPTSPELSPA
jgi:hypothetical protein